MTVFTEGRHAAAFILSEANGQRSRENGTLLSGQDLVAGTVVRDNGSGRLVADAGDEVTEDGSIVSGGILLYDSHADGADLAVSYIARDAEVNGNLLTFAEGTDEQNAAVAWLALLGIIVRF
jgi:hypothetical protein